VNHYTVDNVLVVLLIEGVTNMTTVTVFSSLSLSSLAMKFWEFKYLIFTYFMLNIWILFVCNYKFICFKLLSHLWCSKGSFQSLWSCEPDFVNKILFSVSKWKFFHNYAVLFHWTTSYRTIEICLNQSSH